MSLQELDMGLLIVISLLTSVVMLLAIVFYPKVKFGKLEFDTYWIVTLIGALLLILFGLLDIPRIMDGLTVNTSINPLKILILFLSMTFISIVLDELSFFKYLAHITLKRAGNSQIKIFIYLYIIVSVLTIFTSNDVIILTFTPFICYFSKYANINPIPYLVAEFVAANTWSMALIIGNPTNIYLATSYGINFIDYLSVMILPTFVSSCVAFLVLYLLFRKPLSQPITPKFENVVLPNKPALVLGLVHLSLCTTVLAVSSYIGIEMWMVALFFALSLLVGIWLLYRINKKYPQALIPSVKRVPWQFVPFIISMFVIVLALSDYQVTKIIADFLNNNYPILSYGSASFLAANLINNIPMSVLFSFVLEYCYPANLIAAVYAVIIGSNIGAFLTPFGALAGIMWMNVVKSTGIRYSFVQFVKYGVIISIPTLFTALFVLSFIV